MLALIALKSSLDLGVVGLGQDEDVVGRLAELGASPGQLVRQTGWEAGREGDNVGFGCGMQRQAGVGKD